MKQEIVYKENDSHAFIAYDIMKRAILKILLICMPMALLLEYIAV